jgi:hypothetical protein
VQPVQELHDDLLSAAAAALRTTPDGSQR